MRRGFLERILSIKYNSFSLIMSAADLLEFGLLKAWDLHKAI